MCKKSEVLIHMYHKSKDLSFDDRSIGIGRDILVV